MQKVLNKAMCILGILFLTIIVILNILFTANLDSSEHITIDFNSIIYIIGLIVIGIFLFFITKIIDNKLPKTKIRKYLYVGFFAIYIIFTIIWTITINPPVVGDQVHVCNLAQTFYRGDPEEFLPNITYTGLPLIEYMRSISSANYIGVYI